VVTVLVGAPEVGGVGAEKELKTYISVVTSVGGADESVDLAEESGDALLMLGSRKTLGSVVASVVGATEGGGDETVGLR
jgi:hypothetical protein